MKLLVYLCLLMAVTPLAAAQKETVIVLHGVALHRLFTSKIERTLERAGYDVINVSIPSRKRPVAELGDRWLPELVRKHGADRAPRLHFVAHSMGGLMVRRYLAKERPANLGHVVMIAVPNQGSEIADNLHRLPVLRWIIGCNLPVLGTGPNAFWRQLPTPVDYSVGTIAGTRRITPIGIRWLPRPNDGTVGAIRTHVAGEADYVEVPYSHTGILFRRRTTDLAIRFLRTGRFGG